MITKKLVLPSYKCIRIADFLNFLPISINIQTGKASYENRVLTRCLYQVICFALWLKVLQVFWALITLISNFTPHSFPVVILTGLWLTLLIVATFWNYELFSRGIGETLILFNELKIPDLRGGNRVDNDRLLTRLGAAEAIVGFLKTLSSFSLQELLCVFAPFTVKMFVPIYIVLLLFFPKWSIFSTSLVHEVDGWTWISLLCFVFEVVTSYAAESTILFLLFFQLAFQVTVLIGMKLDVEEQR